jgi:hypothetical protein
VLFEPEQGGAGALFEYRGGWCFVERIPVKLETCGHPQRFGCSVIKIMYSPPVDDRLGFRLVKVYERRRLEGGEMAIRLILDLYIYADYLYKGLHG